MAIKRKAYPVWFNDFWAQANELKTRSLGSKDQAYNEAKRLKMAPADVPEVLKGFKKKTDMYRFKQARNEFEEHHPDMVRILKRGLWEQYNDEYPETPGVYGAIEKTLSKSDQRKAEALGRYIDKHCPSGDMADGLDPIRIGECGVGRTKLIYE